MDASNRKHPAPPCCSWFYGGESNQELLGAGQAHLYHKPNVLVKRPKLPDEPCPASRDVLNLRSACRTSTSRASCSSSAHFKRRGMAQHLQMLRGFWRAEFGKPKPPGVWPFAQVIEWMALMRVGPFATFYEAHKKRPDCPFCGAKDGQASAALIVEVRWEGGARGQ